MSKEVKLLYKLSSDNKILSSVMKMLDVQVIFLITSEKQMNKNYALCCYCFFYRTSLAKVIKC